jgi:hypothetical protein
MPAGWLNALLDAQAAALPSYPIASLVLLLRATARLKGQLPAASVAPLLVALQQQLRGMACRDVAELVWSLGVLRVRPPQQFMATAMAVSARQLSGEHCLDCFRCYYCSASDALVGSNNSSNCCRSTLGCCILEFRGAAGAAAAAVHGGCNGSQRAAAVR